MKTIEVDDELYQYIASKTKFIGESASDILRRLLAVDPNAPQKAVEAVEKQQEDNSQTVQTTTNINESEAQDTVIAESENEPEPEIQIAADAKEVVVVDTKTSCQNIFDVINKEELATQRGAVGRFLLILSNLYRVHSDKFESVLEIRGRNRLYFAKSESELLENGSSTKPKQIPETQYWVITNSNTTKKKLMLTDVANKFGYTAQQTEAIRDLL